MKGFGFALVIFVMGLLGYALYPNVQPKMIQAGWIAKVEPKRTVVLTSAGQAAAPEPGSGNSGESLPEITTRPTIDWTTVTPDRMPARVVLKAEVTVKDPGGDVQMKIGPGQKVKPLRIEGQLLVVSPGDSPFEGRVSPSDTDLLENLKPENAAATPPPPSTPEQTAPTAPESTPAAQPTPASPTEVAPTPPAGNATEPTPTPTTGATEPGATNPPASTPEAPSGTTSTGAPSAADADAVVKAMQESIRGGKVQEFKYEQVLGWKAAGDEQIDGESYQTGLVAYKAETIFGVKTIQAKALIKDGTVVKWIWPKSGMEIK